MRNSFSANVKRLFEKHGIEDEKLELVIAELFDDFQKHLLSPSSGFANEITKKQNFDKNIDRRRRNQFR